MTVAKVGRRQSRRTALFLLYQWDLTGQPMASLYDGTPTTSHSISRRRSRSARRPSTIGSPTPRTIGPPIASVRSSGTSCASGSTSWRREPCLPRWRSTKRSCSRSVTRPKTQRAWSTGFSAACCESDGVSANESLAGPRSSRSGCARSSTTSNGLPKRATSTRRSTTLPHRRAGEGDRSRGAAGTRERGCRRLTRSST